ncbi:MAG: endonuclease, partial [Haliea sp.]
MATKWGPGDELIERRETWYFPDLNLRAKIIAGWEQLDAEVSAYVPTDIQPAVVAAPVQTLPAVSVRLQGQLSVISNLPEIGTALRVFIDRMVPKPATDQQFADAEAECKALKKVEDALESGETAALAELSDVDAMRRAVADLRNLARTTRLAREKLVTAEKENRRTQIVTGAAAALREHVDGLNQRLGKPYMPAVTADFGGAIKGKKNLDSMQDAVDTLLANTKLAANETADRIQVNLTTLRELAGSHAFLFADTSIIVHKAPDDLSALVKARIADHQAAEQRKDDERREQIRKEEQARADREAQERAAREAREQAEAAAATAAALAPVAQPGPAAPAPAPAAETPREPVFST